MEIDLQELGQGLQSVQTSIEVLENDLLAILSVMLLRSSFGVLFVDKLDEVGQLDVRKELVS